MKEVSIIGLDIAKNTFQAHGATVDGGVVFRKKLSRGRFLSFCQSNRLVLLRWKPALRRITGGGRSRRWVMMCV